MAKIPFISFLFVASLAIITAAPEKRVSQTLDTERCASEKSDASNGRNSLSRMDKQDDESQIQDWADCDFDCHYEYEYVCNCVQHGEQTNKKIDGSPYTPHSTQYKHRQFQKKSIATQI